MPDFWLWNNKFRVGGILLAVSFHVVMFTLIFTVPRIGAEGYGFIFYWYMPSIFLGLPWSLLGMFLEVLIPSGSVFGVMASVCLNGYLIGWPIDAMVNHNRRKRQARIVDAYLNAAPAGPVTSPG